MPKGVYQRTKKRFYKRGRVLLFKPDPKIAKAIANEPTNKPQTLWDVVAGWSPNRLKAILERIPLD